MAEGSNRSRGTDGSPRSARDLFEATLNEAAFGLARRLWALQLVTGSGSIRSASAQAKIAAGTRVMIRTSCRRITAEHVLVDDMLAMVPMLAALAGELWRSDGRRRQASGGIGYSGAGWRHHDVSQ
jgi:hypothetical protein